MLPNELKQFLIDGQKSTKCTDQPCQECIKDPCCTNPGPASLENVIEIYKLYKQNKLPFPKDLSFKEFVEQYFTIHEHPTDKTFVIFQPKVIATDGTLVDLNNTVGFPVFLKPPNDIPITINYGCVFNKKKITGKPADVYKTCMLWSEDRFDEVTTLPIGCINNCIIKGFANKRTELINKYYPNSSIKYHDKR